MRTDLSPFHLAHPDKLFIGGRWIVPSGSRRIQVVDSATEDAFLSVPEAEEIDVDRAVAAARKAFDEGPWPRMTPAERAVYMRAIADELDRRSEDLARVWTTESGVVNSAARVTAKTLGDAYRYYASLADTFPFIEKHHPKGGGNFGLLVREPVGVAACIIPWNGPLRLMTFKVAPALMAGCAVVLKASPEAPSSPYLMAEICEAAGLPPGVFNVLTADRQVSEYLVRHSGVDKVSFTGSTLAGKRIASICGERIARVTLELGGKSAGIVLDDYDLDLVAKSLSKSATYLTGQACSSLTHIIISKHRQSQLLEAMAHHFGQIKVGDPFDAQTGMGPLATAKHRERVEGFIAKGCDGGGKLVTGGKRPQHTPRGHFVEPTVFGNISNNSVIAREEIFGPVLAVIPVENEQAAVLTANDSVYGLNASVFTHDAERAYAIGRQLRTGTVGQNAFRSDFSIAFGGFKQSGLGREGGVEGLLPYLETKTLILDELPAFLRN